MNTYLFFAGMAVLPTIVYAQGDHAYLDRIVSEAILKKNEVDQDFTASIGKQYGDGQGIVMILRQQGITTIEYSRQLLSLPDLADGSKRFELPNLQAWLIIHGKGLDAALPEDLQQIYKNASMALQQLIRLEEERYTRRAHNPFAPPMPDRDQEEKRRINGLRASYINYSRQFEEVKLSRYGINTQRYDEAIMPIISDAVRKVAAGAPEEPREDDLNRLFDQLQAKW